MRSVIAANAIGFLALGDVLFVSKGSDFTWNITETLRKFYMIVEERK